MSMPPPPHTVSMSFTTELHTPTALLFCKGRGGSKVKRYSSNGRAGTKTVPLLSAAAAGVRASVRVRVRARVRVCWCRCM